MLAMNHSARSVRNASRNSLRSNAISGTGATFVPRDCAAARQVAAIEASMPMPLMSPQ